MVAKNEVGREGDHHWDSVWDCGDRGLFAIWTCHFCVKNIFPFPLATGKLTGDVLTNRQSGTKLFLSAITPPIGDARWTPHKIRKFSVVWIFILQICSATPIQEINTSAPILLALWMFISWIRNVKLVSSYWVKFRSASPIRRGNAYLYSCSNRKRK